MKIGIIFSVLSSLTLRGFSSEHESTSQYIRARAATDKVQNNLILSSCLKDQGGNKKENQPLAADWLYYILMLRLHSAAAV